MDAHDRACQRCRESEILVTADRRQERRSAHGCGDVEGREKNIALANKETRDTVTAAGTLSMPLGRGMRGVQIFLLDSSTRRFSSACTGKTEQKLKKLLITASARSRSRGKTRAELENVNARSSPPSSVTWSDGATRSRFDSATLVNKGLPCHAKQKWLFGVDRDHIQVVVQPKSIYPSHGRI